MEVTRTSPRPDVLPERDRKIPRPTPRGTSYPDRLPPVRTAVLACPQCNVYFTMCNVHFTMPVPVASLASPWPLGNSKEPSRAMEPRAVADAIRHCGPPGHRPQPTGRGRRQHGQPGGLAGRHATGRGLDRPRHASPLRTPGQRPEGAGRHPAEQRPVGLAHPQIHQDSRQGPLQVGQRPGRSCLSVVTVPPSGVRTGTPSGKSARAFASSPGPIPNTSPASKLCAIPQAAAARSLPAAPQLPPVSRHVPACRAPGASRRHD